MKIAAVSNDGTTISRHFGKARFFVVVTVEDKQVVSREERPKAGHHTFGKENGGCHGKGDGQGFGPKAAQRHAVMLEGLSDCHVVLAGGMGPGILEEISSRGIEPVITNQTDIDSAVQDYIRGRHPGMFAAR